MPNISCRNVLNSSKVFRKRVSRDSAAGITTGYWLDDRGIGVRVPVGLKIFTSSCRPNRLWSPPKTSYPMGTGGSFPGRKAAGA
jgi:hypothetical protein